MEDKEYMSLAERLEYVRNKKIKRLVMRILAVVGITIGMLLAMVLSVLLIVNYGPSEYAHKVFVKSVKETSAIGFLADWFTTPEELEQIMKENTIEELDTVTDTSLIQIGGNTSQGNNGGGTGNSGTQGSEFGFESGENGTSDGDDNNASNLGNNDEGDNSGDSSNTGTNDTESEEINPTGGVGYEAEDVVSEEDGIVIVEVSGATYKGHMMIVADPSRVKVGVCQSLGSETGRGQKLSTIIDRYGAVAGINAGGFADENGSGSGAIPLGYVFSEGQFLYDSGESSLLIGFDENHILHVGNMSASSAKEKGIRDAVTFGPALIINGEAAGINGAGSGLNPRTAIGQRSDGAVLLLVIDGRQANSLGASYGDLIKIMQEFGAVNAANLDGGSSSLMMYKGEQVSNPANVINNRDLPTAIIVM